MIKNYTKENLKSDCAELDLDFDSLLAQMEEWDAGQWALFERSGNDLTTVDDITLIDCGTDEIHFNGEDLLVLTDDEADELYEEDLNNYIDEVIYSEIPAPYQFYFDEERWKADARMNGSRGESLARYDGYEEQHIIDFEDGTTTFIYIYRV